MKILIINGPNLNVLDKREASIYGTESLEEINKWIIEQGKALSINVEAFQSNHEGEIIDKLHHWEEYNFILINAGAYSHYSIAIRDAIDMIDVPVIEVHMSNIYAREEFRHNSVISSVCNGSIVGFGKYSYLLGLYACKNL